MIFHFWFIMNLFSFYFRFSFLSFIMEIHRCLAFHVLLLFSCRFQSMLSMMPSFENFVNEFGISAFFPSLWCLEVDSNSKQRKNNTKWVSITFIINDYFWRYKTNLCSISLSFFATLLIFSFREFMYYYQINSLWTPFQNKYFNFC